MKTPFLRLTAILIASSLLLTLSIMALTGQIDEVFPTILTENPPSVKSELNGYTVILDAGHGGMDGGAQAPDGTLEKDLNLSLVKKVKALLEECGMTVLLTRDEDVMLGSGESGHKKLEDLRARLDFANERPEALLLSIHMNKFPLEYCHGVQLYYAPQNEQSLLLGQHFHENVKNYFQKDNERELKKADSAIYLLERVKSPAVLIECGFLSNPEELQSLKSDEYQYRLAALIASSLSSYYTSARNDK